MSHKLTPENGPQHCEGTPGAARPEGEQPAITVRRLKEDDLGDAWRLSAEKMGISLSDDSNVRSVLRHNPDSIWGIFAKQHGGEGAMLGYYSFLLLNRRGADALLARLFDTHNPPLDLLAPAGERPAAAYMWAVVASGLTVTAFPMIAQAIGALYKDVPTYATAATPAGLAKLTRTAKPVDPKDVGIGALFRTDKHFDPNPERTTAAQRMVSRFKIIVASTPDDLAKVNAVRTVFLHEQDCPFDEEFDGNDLTATHVLAFVDGEPAAVMRIRYFADFVKMERLAVLKRFRATLIKREIVHFSINFCRRKGYTKVYGHSQRQHMGFWKHFGFKELPRNRQLSFSDHGYVEMYGDLHPHSDPITINTDPYVLLRPEGRWDEPGVLEASAQRPIRETRT